jgi:hypothetical protein
VIGQQLVAQCTGCDSIVRAKGYHIITAEEKRKNPRLEDTVATYFCDPNCGLVIKPPPRPLLQFNGKWGYISLRVGVNYDELKTIHWSVGFRFDRPRQQYFAIGFDLDAPEWRGIVIRAEVALKPQEFNGIEIQRPGKVCLWHIKVRTISRDVSLLYKSTKGKLRWFVGAGIGVDGTKIQQNTIINFNYREPLVTENDIAIFQSNWFASLSVGLMYRNRFELRYKRTGTQWSPEKEWYSIKNRSNLLTIGYRF